MANTYGEDDGGILRPWIIRTYRDLFVNVGFELEREEIFSGRKDDLELQALVTLYNKAHGSSFLGVGSRSRESES